MKNIFLILFILFAGQSLVNAQQPTAISATVKGYNGEIIGFHFREQENDNIQFPYTESEKISFEVKLKDITLMKINSWIWIVLRPGEPIHADIEYEGRDYKTTIFSGSPSLVKANEVIRDMRNTRIQNDYKMNPLAAMVILESMENYYAATQKELDAELALLKAAKNELPEDIYNFLYAEHESLLLSNLIKCPDMFANTRKLGAGDYPEGYWNILDNYKLHKDSYSLKSQTYMSFLLIYKHYMRRKTAYEKGEKYLPSTSMEREYADIADFYDGQLRENALFVFLYNQIVGGRDLAEVKPLVKNYLKNYNKGKSFGKTLTNMIQ